MTCCDAKRLHKPTHENRETWLLEACKAIVPLLKAAGGGETPKFRVSVGWPLGKRGGSKPDSHTIGQCFCSTRSKDGTHEIFISPALDSPAEVLATLVHELVHAFVGIKAKHGREFKVVAVKAGLTGKMTATVAGEELKGKLAALAKELGEYPHAALKGGGDSLKKTQSTRMLKVVCPDCEYAVRTTAKWLGIGVPTCPCGTEMVASEPIKGGE